MKTKSSDMHICEFFSNALQSNVLQFQYHTTKLLTKIKKTFNLLQLSEEMISYLCRE